MIFIVLIKILFFRDFFLKMFNEFFIVEEKDCVLFGDVWKREGSLGRVL